MNVKMSLRGREIACFVTAEDMQGMGRTLVFVHGAGGDHTVWVQQYSRLRKVYPVLAIDLPGHGRTGGEGEQDTAAYADWLREILAAFHVEQPILVGQSLGAAVCLTLAVQKGQGIDGVVVLGSGPRMPVNPEILEGFKSDPAEMVAMASRIALGPEHRDRLAPLLAKNLSRVRGPVIYGDFLACSRYDIEADMQKISAPVLAVCGTEDKMTPPSLSRELAEGVQNGQLRLIEGAGHFVMMEDAGGLNAILRGFMETLSTVKTT